MSCNHDTYIFRDANGHRICARCRIPMALEGERWVPEIATRTSAYDLATRDLAKELVALRRKVSRCQGIVEASRRLGQLIDERELAELLDQVHLGLQIRITQLTTTQREEATS